MLDYLEPSFESWMEQEVDGDDRYLQMMLDFSYLSARLMASSLHPTDLSASASVDFLVVVISAQDVRVDCQTHLKE